MQLICPKHRYPLTDLICPANHTYSSFRGIPILLRDDVVDVHENATRSLNQVRGLIEVEGPGYIDKAVASTCGILYRPLINRMTEYPIPDIPLPPGNGSLLDVGCGWGRWVVAAARKGYSVVGVDVSLDALVAAKELCEKYRIDARLVCADARYLPFDDNAFDRAYSFGVLHHFDKPDARLAIGEMKRVAGSRLIQLAGNNGIRTLFNKVKRGFRDAQGAEVRYWTPSELREIGKITPHAYLGTGIIASDARYLPLKYRAIISISEFAKRMSLLREVADSYWVEF